MFELPPLPRTLGAALRDAEHAEPRVRVSALRDLTRLAKTEAREQATIALIGLLRSDPSSELRAEAALALADAEASSAATPLLAALDDPELRVRQLALLALGELGTPGDLELARRLVPFLTASEPALRFQALLACTRLLPERAGEFIAPASADADDEVRAMALAIARRHFHDGSPPEPLLALARERLRDHASLVRAQAALWLAQAGDASADAVLVGIIDRSVPIDDAADVAEAMELAAARGLTGARAALARRAFGLRGRVDALRWHALVALARLDDERARRTILRGLGAWTRDARTLAVVAAGRAGLRQAAGRIRGFRGDARRAEPEAVEEALAALAAPAD